MKTESISFIYLKSFSIKLFLSCINFCKNECVYIYIYIYIYIYGFIVTHRLFFFYKSSFYKLFFPLIYRASTWRYLSFYIYLFYKQALGHTGFSSCDTWAQYLWHMGSVLATHGLSTCDPRASVLVTHGLSTCDTWAQYLWHMDSVLVTPGLWSTGSVVVATSLVVPQHVGSSWTRDPNFTYCFDRQILYHWAIREPLNFLLMLFPYLESFLQELTFFLNYCWDFFQVYWLNFPLSNFW